MFVVCGEALHDVFAEAPAGADGSVRLRAVAGGSPFNVAIGLSRMGMRAGLLAGISRDMFGEALVARLRSEGVSEAFVVRKEQRTTLSVIGLDPTGSPAYSFYGEGAADISLMLQDIPDIGPDVSGLHFGSYTMVAEHTAHALQQLAARESGRFISYDPNIRLNVEPDRAVWQARIAAMLPLATVLKLSAEDVELLWPGREPERLAAEMARQGPALVALTLGGRGAIAFAAGHRVNVTPPLTKVVDTVGAGDAFMAQLIALLHERKAVTRAAIGGLSQDNITGVMNACVLAASMTCERQGADPPRKAELQARMV